MKKTHTRILALLLSMVMTLSLLTACGGNPSTPSNTDTPASPDSQGSAADPADDPLLNNEETINLTVFSQTANWSGAQTGWGATLLKDKFNIELTIIPDTNGAYQTRMESKNLGDIIIWGSNGEEYAAAVNQGLLFDWDEEDLLTTYETTSPATSLTESPPTRPSTPTARSTASATGSPTRRASTTPSSTTGASVGTSMSSWATPRSKTWTTSPTYWAR